MSDHNAPELIFEHTEKLRQVPSDEEIKALEERNEQRRRDAIRALGARWVGVSLNRRPT